MSADLIGPDDIGLDDIGLEGLDNKASNNKASSNKASSSPRSLNPLQNPRLMGLTPEQQQGIAALENVIKTYIVPTNVPKLERIPEPSEDIFPKSQFGTGYISSDGKYAVKNINFLKLISRPVPISIESIRELLFSELINYHAISELCPEYFCKLFGYKYDDVKYTLTIVMENCGKDLFEMYNDHMKKPQPRVIKNHIGQLINILECLHKNDFVHFDLKLENVVIDKNGTLKLIDAGSLIKINDSNLQRVIVRGTDNFMAPELKYILKNTKEELAKIDNDKFLKATDIYSFGIMLIAMIFPVRLGASKIYNEKRIGVFHYWYNFLDYSDKDIQKTVEDYFKEYFGDKIQFKDFFSTDRIHRLTIQDIKLMFEEKMEADKVKSMFEEKMEADKVKSTSPTGQVKRGAEEEPNVFMFRKKTSEGGRKTGRKIKTRNKSRRQRKSRSSRTK